MFLSSAHGASGSHQITPSSLSIDGQGQALGCDTKRGDLSGYGAIIGKAISDGMSLEVDWL